MGGLPEATAGFHKGTVVLLDLTGQSYVDPSYALHRPGAPADVRILLHFGNQECPAVLVDAVNVTTCTFRNVTGTQYADPQPLGDGVVRYSFLGNP